MLGRVFGNLYGGIGGAAALSYVCGGLLLDATSAPITFMIAGGGGMLVTLVVATILSRNLRHYEQTHATQGPPPAPATSSKADSD